MTVEEQYLEELKDINLRIWSLMQELDKTFRDLKDLSALIEEYLDRKKYDTSK